FNRLVAVRAFADDGDFGIAAQHLANDRAAQRFVVNYHCTDSFCLSHDRSQVGTVPRASGERESEEGRLNGLRSLTLAVLYQLEFPSSRATRRPAHCQVRNDGRCRKAAAAAPRY